MAMNMFSLRACVLGAAFVSTVASEESAAGHDIESHEPRSFLIDHTGGGVFLFAAILLGIATRSAGSWVKLPYTVVLLVCVVEFPCGTRPAVPENHRLSERCLACGTLKAT